ncbi:MAG: hypothetical protein K0U98_01680 [Deltaproteobacteria bacterium]|nr:hypothetical protein [Deltaproteobacteria bacterium]
MSISKRGTQYSIGFCLLVAILLLPASPISAQPEGCDFGGSNWFQHACSEIGDFVSNVWRDIGRLFDPPPKREREEQAAGVVHPRSFFDRWLDENEIHDGNPWVSGTAWIDMIEDSVADAQQEAGDMAAGQMRDVVDSVMEDTEAEFEEHCRVASELEEEIRDLAEPIEDLARDEARSRLDEILDTIRSEAPQHHPIQQTVDQAASWLAGSVYFADLAEALLSAIGSDRGDACSKHAADYFSEDWYDYPSGLDAAVEGFSEEVREVQYIVRRIFDRIDDGDFSEDYQEWLCDLEWWIFEALILHDIRGGSDIDWSALPGFGSCEGEPHAVGVSAAGSSAPPPEEIDFVIQLGDSYSAGFGVLPTDPPAPPGGQGHCDNPIYSHQEATPGFQLVEYIQDVSGNEPQFIFEACGGAELLQRHLEVQWNNVQSLGLELGTGEGTIIVFTIGGNDVRTRSGLDWVSVVSLCIRTDCLEGDGAFQNEINNLPGIAGELLDQLELINYQLPDATIRVLGYPLALQPMLPHALMEQQHPVEQPPGGGRPSAGDGSARRCPGLSGMSVEEADFLDGQTRLLNEMLPPAVEEAASFRFINLSFVEVQSLFRGHGACNNEDPFINDVDYNLWPPSVEANSLHPLQGGWDAYFHAFLDSLGWW